jgi:hypothetical protein
MSSIKRQLKVIPHVIISNGCRYHGRNYPEFLTGITLSISLKIKLINWLPLYELITGQWLARLEITELPTGVETALHWLARLEITEHQPTAVETALRWLARLGTFVVLPRPPNECNKSTFTQASSA